MNWYRNAHYQESNKVKHLIKEYLSQFQFKKYDKIKMDIEIIFKDNRLRDICNYEAVASKMVLDALVELEVIPDDTYKHYLGYTVRFGGINKSLGNIAIFTIIKPS